SPRVFAALATSLSADRLRKYPDPMGTAFRQAAGKVLGMDPDAILIGNGSDDILTILTRTFVPEGGLITAPTPSYILYRSLAEIQGANFAAVPFTTDWQVPLPWPKRGCHLTFIPNPNSPSGTCISVENLRRFAQELDGPLVIDEAYVDFADTDALVLAK